LGHEQSEPLLALHPLLAEFVVGTEAGGVGVEGVGAVLEHHLEGVDSVAAGVQVISQVHPIVEQL